MRQVIIGVMGPADSATEQDLRNAFRLGGLIAARNWTVLSGGRNVGVMDAVSRGAREAGGLVIGILPEADHHNESQHLDVAIVTGMGTARNSINVLTSDICGIARWRL